MSRHIVMALLMLSICKLSIAQTVGPETGSLVIVGGGMQDMTILHRFAELAGVIGGSSAGATILGSYLARGDTQNNTTMMGDHETGFGFLKQSAIDQHLLRRNRQFDLIEIIDARPELLGIGLDENTAIVVRGDRFEVIGQSYIAIFDHQRMLNSGGKFYFLEPGDIFDLKQRQAFRPQRILQPFDRVIEQQWP